MFSRRRKQLLAWTFQGRLATILVVIAALFAGTGAIGVRIPAAHAGPKPLYLHNNGTLSRVATLASQKDIRLTGGQSATWTLAPSTYQPITIDGSAGTIPVTLWIRGGTGRVVNITLSTSAGVVGMVGPVNITRFNYGSGPWTFQIPVSDPTALLAVDSVQLTVDNISAKTNQQVRVQSFRNGIASRVDIDSFDVIEVDSVEFFDAPYPGGTALVFAPPGTTVYVRAVVSDPFGAFDIASASMTFTSSTGTDVVTNAPMLEVAADANGPNKTFELVYPEPPAVWPNPIDMGGWMATVTAEEGTEGLVRHTGTGILLIAGPPDIVLVKSVQSYSDPVNGNTNPFSLPGAFMNYSLVATNQGGPGVTTDSIVITDPVPANTMLWVGDLGAPWGPIGYSESTPPSGLTFDPSTDLAFSMDGGSTYPLSVADLVPDASGCDPRVTHLRVNPKGNIAGISGAGIPGFTLLFRVQVQ